MIARTRGLLAVAIASGTCVVACGALIGTRDLTLVEGENDGGTTLVDGTTPAIDSNVPAPDANGTGDDDGSITTDSGPDAACTGATNLQGDNANCGVCGHSCLGGACSTGFCQPIAIATGQDGAYAVVVDDTSVYWVSYTGNTVMKSAKDGTALTLLANTNVDSPWNLAVDATYVYWTNLGGSIARCAKSGCGSTGQVLATNLNSPEGIAVDTAHVFWGEYQGYDVGRMSTDGGAFGYLQTNLNHAYEVAIDDASVFFTTQDTIGSMPKGAVTVPTGDYDAAAGFTTVASIPIGGFGIAVDDTNVYWVEDDDPGRVAFAPKTGTSDGGATLAGGQHYPARIALDDANVYWVAYGPDTSPNQNTSLFVDSYVATCPKTGCTAGQKILAGALKNARGIAVDDKAVYWALAGNTSGEGAIVRLAK